MSRRGAFPPFFPIPLMPRGDDRLRRFRVLYNRAAWRNRSRLTTRAVMVATALCWPIIGAVLCALNTARWGGAARRRGGPGRLRQWWDAYRWSITRALPPLNYYSFRLYETGMRERLDEFLWYDHGWRAFEFFNVGGDIERIADKSWLARRCEEMGIPCIPTVAEFNGGKVTFGIDDPAKLPAAHLFAKRSASRSAWGATRWRHVAPGVYVDQDGNRRTAAEMWEQLRTASVGLRHIVQVALSTHSALRDLAPNALATARVLTVQRGDRVEALCANYKVPRATAFVDNMAAGGLAAAIDPATGTLGPGITHKPDVDWHTHHPDTGVPIAGRVLPDWPAALALCVDAHRRFRAPFIGWDLALTDDGPLIVEANTHPGVELFQLPQRKGMFAFPSFLDAMLAAAEAASDPARAGDPNAAPSDPARSGA